MTAEQERAAVVRWLREMDAKRPSVNFCAWIARMIEAGEHVKETSE